MGYGGGLGILVNDFFGFFIFFFKDEILYIELNEEEGSMFFDVNNVGYSSDLGKLFCMFNGEGVYSSNYEIM